MTMVTQVQLDELNYMRIWFVLVFCHFLKLSRRFLTLFQIPPILTWPVNLTASVENSVLLPNQSWTVGPTCKSVMPHQQLIPFFWVQSRIGVGGPIKHPIDYPFLEKKQRLLLLYNHDSLKHLLTCNNIYLCYLSICTATLPVKLDNWKVGAGMGTPRRVEKSSGEADAS